jgi:hypothetical protein
MSERELTADMGTHRGLQGLTTGMTGSNLVANALTHSMF